MRIALYEYSIQALNEIVKDHMERDRLEIKPAYGNSKFVKTINKLNIIILVMVEIKRMYND